MKKYIIVSAAGANPKSKIFYNRVKGEMEADLKNINFESLVIFRPGLLMGERKEKRTLEKISIQTVKIIEKLLPQKILTPFITKVDQLTFKILNKTVNQSPKKIDTIDSKEI